LKKLLLFFTFAINLFASTLEIEQKIYTVVLKALFPAQSKIILWTDNQEKKKVFQNLPIEIKITNNKQQADILIVYDTPNLKTEKLIFAGTYRILKLYKNQAIGGFYWQKGRPNLIFIQKTLSKNHIELPKELLDYVEESL